MVSPPILSSPKTYRLPNVKIDERDRSTVEYARSGLLRAINTISAQPLILLMGDRRSLVSNCLLPTLIDHSVSNAYLTKLVERAS